MAIIDKNEIKKHILAAKTCAKLTTKQKGITIIEMIQNENNRHWQLGYIAAMEEILNKTEG